MTNIDELKLYISESEIQEAIKNLADKLNDIYNDEEVCMICVLKGAVIFAVDLAKKLKMPLDMQFIKLSSYGSGYASTGKVNAIDIKLPDLNGKNVLIVEDIIDTGHTAKFLIDFLKYNFHVKSLKFCSLLDKRVKREVDIDADFYCFEVEDKFLVGYGLDLEDKCRNLTEIYYLEKYVK